MVAYRIKYLAPAFGYVLLIIGLSSLSQEVVAAYSWGIQDFLLHGTEYHFYGVTLIWAFLRNKPQRELRTAYGLAVSVGALTGMADEFYQSFVPSRCSTIDDVVADVFGVILSIITFRLLMRIPKFETWRRHA